MSERTLFLVGRCLTSMFEGQYLKKYNTRTFVSNKFICFSGFRLGIKFYYERVKIGLGEFHWLLENKNTFKAKAVN